MTDLSPQSRPETVEPASGAPVEDAPVSTPGAPGSPTADGQGAGAPAMHTRASASWVALVVAVVFLILLVIFIAQNTQRSTVNFLGMHGHAPVAVVLLVAALAGAVIVIIAGATRILQLRRAVKHPEGRRRNVGRRRPSTRPSAESVR
jgi:uncharacterized integral membrane protein